MWSLCRVQASVFSLTLCCCCTVAGQSKLAKAVLKLFGASLCSSWNLLNPPGYPRKPAVQCVHSPVVARKKVNPELIGESFLSTNCLTLLLHLLPQRASRASVGDFPSSSRVVEEVEVVEGASPVAAWKAMFLLRSTATVAT